MKRRFVQMPDGELIEVGDDYLGESRASNRYIGDAYYDGNRAPDGTDISTRSKHRAYMKEKGLTTVDDFAGEFAKRAEQRERFQRDGYDPTRRRMIEESIRYLANGGRPKGNRHE
jgi:hypothetical protein